MIDQFEGSAQSTITPSENAFPVTPDDEIALSLIPKYLYVGGAGRVTLRTKDAAADVVFENVPAGGYIYVRASHVRATGTTATAIVACA
jgi:hypothetical protein